MYLVSLLPVSIKGAEVGYKIFFKILAYFVVKLSLLQNRENNCFALYNTCLLCSTQCKRETDLERERVKRQASADQLGGGDNDQLGGKDESPPFNRVVHLGLSLPLLPHVCQVSQLPSLDEKKILFHLETDMCYYMHDILL